MALRRRLFSSVGGGWRAVGLVPGLSLSLDCPTAPQKVEIFSRMLRSPSTPQQGQQQGRRLISSTAGAIEFKVRFVLRPYSKSTRCLLAVLGTATPLSDALSLARFERRPCVEKRRPTEDVVQWVGGWGVLDVALIRL